MNRVVCAIFAIASACDRKSERTEPEHAVTNVLAGATAVFDRLADGSLHVVIGDGVTCAAAPREVVEVELRSRLAPDGSISWTLGNISTEPNSVARLIGTATASLRETPDADGRLAITLGFEVPGRGPFAPNLGAHGTVLATECHPTARIMAPPTPTTPVRSSATITIAGKQLTIAGAIRRGADIELSDVPRSCSATWLTGATLTRKSETWTLGGGLFATRHRGDGKGLEVTAGKNFGELVPLTLSGTAVIDGYTVVLAGEIEAVECPLANANPPEVRVGFRQSMPPGVDLDQLSASGHTGGDDNDEVIGCASLDGQTWCYARAADGERAGCLAMDRITIDMIRSIPSYGSLSFDWERGKTACAGVTTYRQPGDHPKPSPTQP